jgi:imidazoleglycerol-phosphate dehydratase
MREATITRTTKETDITMSLALDKTGKGSFKGSSGIGFFDHMLNSFCVHGGFAISLDMKGDLQVDGHHTVEDVGIVLGKLFADILGDRGGIKRFGSCFLPMDEALAFCAIDISGRPYLHYDAPVTAPMVGDYDAQLTEEFMRALAVNMGATLHTRLEYGVNQHHITEAIFKAVARAIGEAITPFGDGVLSAKGVL